jgi:hypothetical protein
MNASLARERAMSTAVNTMVPAAAKAGRQETAKKSNHDGKCRGP